VLVLLLRANSFGQGYSPEEAAQRMTVADGLEVNLYASEPDIRQPVVIEFDDRGRLWVIQYLQYPNPAGLERVEVDRYSRTTYDRTPEPPPQGPKGADRITICEDTDGDGKADKFKDFVDGLNLTSGLAFGYGGVYVLNPPYLLFYPDRDRDDVPDSDPEVLLKGFGIEDSHSVANSLTWGPDGWLYGLQGSTVTANIDGIEFQQGVWRIHPKTKEFELFAEGGGNMWGMDFDPFGNLIANTNFGGYMALHMVRGGYYWKQFGKHGDLHNPYTYGYLDHIPHENFTGGHVSVGGMFYWGGSFPEEWNGRFLSPNLLSHDFYWHEFEREGSSFRSKHGGVVLDSNDTWFAPTDMTIGPDGAVYVSDWHDKRTAHPDPDADWDRSNGRVFRVQANGANPTEPFDLGDLSDEELIEFLHSSNNWFERRARVLLASRNRSETVSKLRSLVESHERETNVLEVLWALDAGGNLTEEMAAGLLSDEQPPIRRWAAKTLGEIGNTQPESGETLIALANTEPDPTVRNELASAATFLPAEIGLPILRQILLRDQDGEDPHIPLLLWWGIEHFCIDLRELTLDLFTESELFGSTLFKKEILPRLVRRYAAEGSPAGEDSCLRILQSAPESLELSPLFSALNDGLSDRSRRLSGPGGGVLFTAFSAAAEIADQGSDPTSGFGEPLEKDLKDRFAKDPNDLALALLNARLGNNAAISAFETTARDERAEAESRASAIGALGDYGGPEFEELFWDFLGGGGSSDPVRQASLDALSRSGDSNTGKRLIEGLPEFGGELKSQCLDALCARKDWAKELLQSVDRGEILAELISQEQLRKLALHEDEELNDLMAKHWGVAKRGTPEEKLAEMRRLSNDLRAFEGDPVMGKAVFEKLCATCHRFNGVGHEVGPDLMHSNRKDRDFMLVSLVDPSLWVRKEYLQYMVETVDGNLYNGIVTDRSPGSVTLLNANSEKQTIATEDILEIRESEISLMPEDQLKPLTPDEVRGLFAYMAMEFPGK
jgi:putative membrane-bound dehydrogenase-like protein